MISTYQEGLYMIPKLHVSLLEANTILRQKVGNS